MSSSVAAWTATATALAAATLFLAAAPAAAQTQCAPGFFLSAPSTCSPCAANTYSFGGAAAACAPCLAADAFASADRGCAPGWGSVAVAGPALYVSGASALGLAPANMPAAQPGPVYDADHMGRAAGATRVTTEYFQTGALPQLPTGNGARTLAAWVNCAQPGTATGPTLLELADPAGSPLRQGFSVRAPTGAAALPGTTPPYSSQIVAGLPFTGTCAGAVGVSGDGVGTNALFFNPQAMRFGLVSGNLYVADTGNHRIRVLNPATGMVTTLAGSSVGSGFVDNAVGTAAKFGGPSDLLVDPKEQFVVVADTNNNRIRLINISAAGNNTVTTIAGSGLAGGLSGIGTNAAFSAPIGLAMDSNADGSINAIYVADKNSPRIRKITWSTLEVTTIGGSGLTGTALNGGGGQLNQTSTYMSPRGLTLTPDKQLLLVSDQTAGAVRRINLTTLSDSWWVGVAGAAQTTTYNGPAVGSKIGGPLYPAFNPVGLLIAGETWGNQIVACEWSGGSRLALVTSIAESAAELRRQAK